MSRVIASRNAAAARGGRGPSSQVQTLRRRCAALEQEVRRARRAIDAESVVHAIAGVYPCLTHELRNALGAAALRVDTLQALAGGIEGVAGHLGELRSSLGDALAVLDRVDRLRRPSAGESCDLTSAIADVAAMLAPVFRSASGGRRPVQLDLDLEAPSRWVRGDAGDVRIVLVALLLNARQAMPHGGRVRVELAPLARGRVAVTVADEGPGIPRRLLDRIFEPHFTTRTGATGLGLTIARELLRGMGGRVTAAGRPGGGAVFTAVFAGPADGAGTAT